MKPLITLNSELGTGLHPGLNFDDVPLWEDGANVVFKRDALLPLIPHIALAQKPDGSLVRGMFEAGHELFGYQVFYGTKTRLYRWTRQNGIENVSKPGGYTGSDDSFWQFCQWGSWIIATNGADAPQVLKSGAGTFVDLPTQNSGGATFTTAEILLPYKSFLIALNTSNAHPSPLSGGQDFVHFSESDDPEKWDPTDPNNGEAGDLPIRDAEGAIRAAILYRRTLFFFTDHGGHVLNFVGAPEFFGTQKVLNAGCVGKQAVDEYGNLLYGFGMNRLWRSDGSQVVAIEEPSIHEFVFGELNHKYRHRALVWANPFDGIVEFHFPIADSEYNNRAVGFSPDTNTWTIITRVRSSAARKNTMSFGVTGTADGDLLAQQTGDYATKGRSAPTVGVPFGMEESYSQGYGYGMLGYGEGGYGGTGS